MDFKFAKEFDVIKIVESHYEPEHPIGNIYVVVGSLDGCDCEIINEHGEYKMVAWEDYEVIGNVNDLRAKAMSKVYKTEQSSNFYKEG